MYKSYELLKVLGLSLSKMYRMREAKVLEVIL